MRRNRHQPAARPAAKPHLAAMNAVGVSPPQRLATAARLPRERVATVHGYPNQRGGAEHVVLAMAERCPDAAIYTSVDEPGSTFAPVVAYGRGGACETVIDRVTGVLFEEQSVDSLRRAILACEELATSPAVIAENAERFSRKAFASRLAAGLSVARNRRDERMESS